MTNGDSVGTSAAATIRPQSHLQFNPSRVERLRQITKDCQKNFLPQPKPNGSKLPLNKGPTKEVNLEKNVSKDAGSLSPDLIISSAGSSPAHSPQPMDFKMLSTPPRSSKPIETNLLLTNDTSELNSTDRQKACVRLVEKFDESSNKTLPNGVCPNSRLLDQDSSSVEVLEEGDQTCPVNSVVKPVHVNGEIDSLGGTKDKDNVKTATKDRNSPALSDVAPSSSAEETTTRGFNFNSDEFRQVSMLLLIFVWLSFFNFYFAGSLSCLLTDTDK